MSVVEEIKQRVDIVDLVSQYVTLKRAGRDYMAPCPFHAERTPSFHVSPARQSWHCFGACGTGGDIFSFVMKKEEVEFRDALRILAERAGVELESRRDPQEDARRARLFEANESAAAFFHAQLLAGRPVEDAASNEAAVASDYIAERHLTAKSVEQFQLGYAPNSWQALTEHLGARGFSNAEIVAAGLAIEGERGVHDRFRHRLMFPIRDERGRVAGFGGRMLPGEALGAVEHPAKYVNTPQTPIFDKGAILFALDLAKDAIRSEGRAVIVEGYMDAIAAHEHGFGNVVASMGTALTERQVTLLKRHTRNLVLALDADAAGAEGMLRGGDVLDTALPHENVPVPDWRGIVRMQEKLAADIRVLVMPGGQDPDDVIRNQPGAVGRAGQWRAAVSRLPIRRRERQARPRRAARALRCIGRAAAARCGDPGSRAAVALPAAPRAPRAGRRVDVAPRDAAAGAPAHAACRGRRGDGAAPSTNASRSPGRVLSGFAFPLSCGAHRGDRDLA